MDLKEKEELKCKKCGNNTWKVLVGEFLYEVWLVCAKCGFSREISVDECY
jgi:ribosomal protein L37E